MVCSSADPLAVRYATRMPPAHALRYAQSMDDRRRFTPEHPLFATRPSRPAVASWAVLILIAVQCAPPLQEDRRPAHLTGPLTLVR